MRVLEDLTIRDLGVIADADVEFGHGFNVVTGETGAGKTMVVTALGLLLGERADAALVRHGADQARVEGHVALDDATGHEVIELGGDVDDGVAVVARTVSAAKRSRARVGGAGAPVTRLAGVMGRIVGVHGQSDQHELLQASRQRDCLDALGGDAVARAAADYTEAFDRLAEVRRRLDDVVTGARERAREADLLRLGLEEIAAVEPQPGEDAALLAEENRLAHADGLVRAAATAHGAVSGDDDDVERVSVLDLVAMARKALEAEEDHDTALDALAERLASVSYLLSDLAADLAAYVNDVDADPARLASVAERRAALAGLTRKYGDSVDDVLAWSQQAAERLAELDSDDDTVVQLRAEEAELVSTREAAAAALSAARAEAAEHLAERVTHELAGLAMPHARFEVSMTPADSPRRDGYDDIVFCLAGHDGAAPRPISKGASGGELSRIMLAIEVCLAGAHPLPTLVFDEVDAGVGGKAAVEVGRRLARLSRSRQVICVTHLPQVAAFADRHLVVTKSDDGTITTSGVGEVTGEARRVELSRMLAGLEESASAQAHADELLAMATAERDGAS